MFLSVILLVGCATPAERRAAQAQEEHELWRAQQARKAKCSGYGFQIDTTAFSQCLQQVEQQQYWQREAEREAHFQRAQCYLSQTGNFKLCP